METLVISQVAPAPHQYHSHHMMVSRNSHREGDSNADDDDETGSAPAQYTPPSSSSTIPVDDQSHAPQQQQQQPHYDDYREQPPSTATVTADRDGESHDIVVRSESVPANRRQPQSSPSSPRLQPTYRSMRSLGGSEASSPSRIKVRDLSHIQSFASEEYLARPRLGQRSSSAFDPARQYEISSMPVTDIIEMVAGLLTKITTTNDQQHEHLARPVQASPDPSGGLSSNSSCVLAFHGKNVPSITILSYLSRIHKYCPTTYEVFLSLLVYFDRMTDNFNKKFMQRHRPSDTSSSASEDTVTDTDVNMADQTSDETDTSQIFVVDSFNIHRLVIAGVTCASKFFSDIFYTNSRYAKVGGLPLVELNNLELQFLLLNDFRLSIPVEELEAYGTMLVEFYAREIIAQQQATQAQHRPMHMSDSHGDDMYMRGSRS